MSDASVPLELRIDLDPRIHFALQQNDVPVVKALHIENRSAEPLRDLELYIRAEPAFALPWSARIAEIAPEAVYSLEAVDLELSPGLLGELTERLGGQLRIELQQSGQLLATQTVPVELLARDEWSGLASLPEILAAFVLPNHPALEPVLRSAADVLGRWTGDPALAGYQARDRRRVYQITAAVYAALRALDLTYVNPPASFEQRGQRVRLPERILGARMATCLDVALLTAGCLEQAGLHPLLVLVPGHAFCGVWLHEECFPEAALDDGLRLLKRVDLGEIAIFDPTAVTARPSPDFERAVAEARRRLSPDAAFVWVIDVHRARKGRIRPLPEHAGREGVLEESEKPAPSLDELPPPDLSVLNATPEPEAAAPGASAQTPATRLERWCRRLLDLSLRNRLLNFRDNRKTLPLLCPDLALLEDRLASGASFQVLPQPDELRQGDPRDAAAHQRRTGEEALDALLRAELRSHRIHSNTTAEELGRRMLEIYRAARLGLEEGGASGLYLALGFLSWFESEKSEQPRRAPIVLLPLEVQRKSVREGFTLKLADDEPRINVTLLQMLKQDHGLSIAGLDPLPEDESGLNIGAIFQIVRQAVRDIDRWHVVEEAWIGLFSFTKFLMWKDLSERSDALLKNPLVAHLVQRPDQAFAPGTEFPSAERLDQERPTTETFCPLPADSSQLAAVFAAAEGRSFVLEGPPGTGKSQTITNLIAHCLTQGKTVLFVSEKMAALSVVQRRLGAVGLGRYCLELHSNKAQKREIIGQIESALRRTETRSEEDWAREARRLEELRSELNAYVDALHRRQLSGESVFQVTSRLIGLRDALRVELGWSDPEALDADALAALRELVERLATVGTACGEPAGHAWQGARRAEWTPSWDEAVQRAVSELQAAVQTVGERARVCAAHVGLAESGWSAADLGQLRELGSLLLASPSPPTALLVRPDWDEIQGQVAAWLARGRERDQLRAAVREGFRDEITGLDLDNLQRRATRAHASWWPASWWRRRPVRRALRAVARDGRAPTSQQLLPLLERAHELRQAQRTLEAASASARELLGRHWNAGEAQWDGVAGVVNWARGVRSLASRSSHGDLERAAALRERWARLATEGRELLRPDASIGSAFVGFGKAHDALEQRCTQLAELLDLDAKASWGAPDETDRLGRLRSSAARWQAAARQLRDWCAWLRVRAEAVPARLGPLIQAYEDGQLQSGQLRPTFERSYAQAWLAAMHERDPLLRQFFSPEHERKIQQFRATDEQYMQLTRDVLQARLAARVPAASAADLPNSEMGILKREVGKRRRHLPVRQLLHRIPNLLPRLKPCLLMSPMSVAQYLDAEYPPFDVVVFDEASQIPVWDAIGAIARGRQAVIVGDPKQLPPTSFFQRAEDEEADADADLPEDLESILDDCIGSGVTPLSLTWHYRSRHESLIAFSNHHYYGNRLLTFPSPALRGLGVRWHPVPGGVYDKGKSRTNRGEADAVVAEILRRLRNPQLAGGSLGVVTFSQAQQTLIEDLLDAERAADPILDAHFAQDAEEPIFVKNLENVQGDERDVILFSIAYGPDAHGQVSMNFGPMNRDGGERRLNVAITRARREVLVFSTLRADQIDLSRTRARGVRDLKGFLEYAERGPRALAEATEHDPEADFDSPFEEAVFEALAQRGWQVHKQVGCARYRIDLAVLDPRAPGRYLLGIECDGANYHRAKTARDRDKLREGVLRDLGWTLHRIWSTDWWNDPQRELAKTEAALEAAKAAPRNTALASPPRAPTPADSQTEPSADPPAVPPGPQAASAPPHPPLERYTPAELPKAAGSQSQFYENGAERAIHDRLLEVVRQEAPVSFALAARRVAAAWGFERIRDRAQKRIRDLIPEDQVQIQESPAGCFLWPRDAEPHNYSRFRIPGPDGSGARSAEDLPPEEVAAAVLHLLEAHASAPQEELLRETARLFGFQRTGRLVQERLQSGLDLLLQRGRVTQSGGTIALTR